MVNLLFKELKYNKKEIAIIFVLTTTIGFLVLTTSTNRFAFDTQVNEVKSKFKIPLDEIFIGNFIYFKDFDNSGFLINQFKNNINQSTNMNYAAYDESGTYFDELKNDKQFINMNKSLYEGSYREETPNISEVIFIDPELLKIINSTFHADDFNIIKKENDTYYPIFISEYYKEILPIDKELTLSKTKEKFIVKGYLSNEKWFDDNDPITMPLKSFDNKFLTIFSEQKMIDDMVQQSTSGKIFIWADNKTEKIDIFLKEASKNSGFKMKIISIDDYIKKWILDNEKIVKSNILMFGIVFICSVFSIISLLCVNILLNKKTIGIKVVFGNTMNQIISILCLKNILIMSTSCIISYLLVRNLYLNESIFRELYLDTLKTKSILFLVFIYIIMFLLTSILPIRILKKNQISSLIKEINL